MAHDDFSALLAAFADGELEERRRLLIAQHVRHCSECARRLKELRRLSRALRVWELPGDSAERAQAFAHSLAQLLPKMPAASSTRRLSWTTWAFPAGLVLWGALVEAAAILTLAFGLVAMFAGLFEPANAWLSWLAGLLPSPSVPAWFETIQKLGNLGCQALGIAGFLPASLWEWQMSFLIPTLVYVSLLAVICLGVWGWFGAQMARRRL